MHKPSLSYWQLRSIHASIHPLIILNMFSVYQPSLVPGDDETQGVWWWRCTCKAEGRQEGWHRQYSCWFVETPAHQTLWWLGVTFQHYSVFCQNHLTIEQCFLNTICTIDTAKAGEFGEGQEDPRCSAHWRTTWWGHFNHFLKNTMSGVPTVFWIFGWPHLAHSGGRREGFLRMDWCPVPRRSCCVWVLWHLRVCHQLTLDRLAPRTYSSEGDLQRDGNSLFLRPWQLPHRVDYGLRGTCDGDPFHEISD